MSYLKFAAGVATAVALTLSPLTSNAQDSDALIAKIDGVEIKQSDFDLFQTLDQSFAQLQGEQKRLAVLSAIIDVKSLAKKAEAEKFADGDDFKKRMQLLRERTLHNAYFQKKVITSVTEEDAKARFDKELAAATPEVEVRARHILVKTLEEAKAVIKQLDEGTDFVELAKEKSTGPSGPNGGDLGFFGSGQMVPEFETAAFALEAGAYTKEPVKTQFGFHVIKLEEKRDRPFPKFEEVSDNMRQVLLRERYLELVKTARAEVEIEILDEGLKTAYEQNAPK
jgi:peptidyl-prolyl cis-trans isomerase C